MRKTKRWLAGCGMALLCGGSWVYLGAQEPQVVTDDEPVINADHSQCTLFGSDRDHFYEESVNRMARKQYRFGKATVAAVSHMSQAYAAALPDPKGAAIFDRIDQLGFIDQFLFKAMQKDGVEPANRSNDYEFIRRVTFDLTGRPPKYDRVVAFAESNAPDKRAKLIDELLNTPEWVDKWTMFLGDQFKNVDDNGQARRFAEGRNAFYQYIKTSLASNKPYDKMVTEMITATGSNSWEQGELNWNISGMMTGGPVQDNYDFQGEIVADRLLGMGHQNCLLCHNGRGHMEALSVWGKSVTRVQAQGLSAFFSKSVSRRTYPEPANRNVWYSSFEDAPRNAEYSLNTTTGNRTPRQPLGDMRTVLPNYPFGDGGKPRSGENYREALARIVVADPQFARASVNFIWKQFFVRGIVEPANLFDPGRMDPANPPPAPWTIQPTNPELLNALAADFQKSGFSFRDLMRKICNSEAYQLSSAYAGNWQPQYENYFARHFVRRLWAEEVVDGITQVSNSPMRYTYNTTTPLLPGMPAPAGATVNWTMQLPQTRTLPGGAMAQFLDSFLRGNRIDAERNDEGAIPQVLNLMNDSFVMDRTRAATNGGVPTLTRQLLDKYTSNDNAGLVRELFLTVLSRPPSADESITANGLLGGAVSPQIRQQRLEDLVWSLYNKVDFVFNY
ncbi:MAG: DUF1549 and DUF1553 domain-containing protein [Bryobacteraceae bacterium]|nr:DUF1549 and DUF1553 domain-containing protein [Bryobacteraceae bacterium]